MVARRYFGTDGIRGRVGEGAGVGSGATRPKPSAANFSKVALSLFTS